jgi:hypothetical protein
MIGGMVLIMGILLAARPVLGQQPEEEARAARQDTILTRITTLESRIDSLITELSSLKQAVVAAGIPTEPAAMPRRLRSRMSSRH